MGGEASDAAKNIDSADVVTDEMYVFNLIFFTGIDANCSKLTDETGIVPLRTGVDLVQQ